MPKVWLITGASRGLGRAFTEEALKAGCHTTSKRFIDSVWTMLSTMDNVENVKGQGYRLKRSK